VGLCVSEESAGFNKEHGSRMGYIGVLCVLSGHRRGGIGAALLSEGIEWVLDRGMDEIFLAVDAENPGALRLYTEHGFSILREGSYYRVSL
jgi:ribosomal protein S18 acetylase RimI-like enzyme